MITEILLLILGFVLLVRGADVFVDAAAGIARKFKIPAIIIGTTIVAIGTSAPEAAISIIAALKGADGVSVGNVIGSNITNIFLILGVTAAIGTIPVHKNTKKYELPFVGFITLLLAIFGLTLGQISRGAAIILLALFVAFLIYTIIMARKSDDVPDDIKPVSLGAGAVLIIAGIAALVYGSNMVVDSATAIAQHVGVSDRVIGLTLIALGTSLPELVVCIIAAIKRQYDLAIGNIVGSNIFNILFVLGMAAAIRPIPFQIAFLTDTAVALGAIAMLILFTYRGSKLTRIGGIVFLLSYIAYTAYLVI